MEKKPVCCTELPRAGPMAGRGLPAHFLSTILRFLHAKKFRIFLPPVQVALKHSQKQLSPKYFVYGFFPDIHSSICSPIQTINLINRRMDSVSMNQQHSGGGYYGHSGKSSTRASSSNFIQQQQQQPTSYDVWNNFLISAGIPSSVSHDYAITFSQHRIRIDMLKEITKDILIDMGIKAMGDIIAILRHAKQICTQNELKTATGMIKSAPSVNNSMQVDSPMAQQHQASPANAPKPHLSQRTPITLNRSSPSVSSLIGNKIQSRLNLESGALVASSSLSSQSSMNDSTSTLGGGKRPASTLSTSMAKRLRPAETEKTLTVHYPPKAAIARAAQRISGSNNVHKTGSIKSRLGSTASHSGREYKSFNLSTNVTNNHRSTYKSKSHNRSSSTTPNDHSDRRRESRRSKERTSRDDRSSHNNRPKSTVFNRLGETIR
jgi:hypothetical protein